MTPSPSQSPSPSVPAAELCVEWSARTRSFDAGDVCGDAGSVVAVPHGALLAAIDGLGHGAEAAAAAAEAVNTIVHDADKPVLELMKRCHEALRKTRGAAMTMASIDAASNTLSWAGVGNVEAMLFRADETLMPRRESLSLRGGVVGYQIPPLHLSTVPVFAGDVLVMVTDGIDGGFSTVLTAGRSSADIAEDILEYHAKGTDDALVLAAVYTGLRP